MVMMLERPRKRRPTVVIPEEQWDQLDWSKSDQELADELNVNKARVNLHRKKKNIPCATADQQVRREQFARFLKRNAHDARSLSIHSLLQRSGVVLTPPTAYRIACNLGFRGTRHNRSKLLKFWSRLNWKLPDSDLSDIWSVERGNIQSKRRVLMRFFVEGKINFEVATPAWRREQLAESEEYREALAQEQRKRSAYKGTLPGQTR